MDTVSLIAFHFSDTVDLIVSNTMDIPFLIAFQADITTPFMKVKVNCILVFISIHFLITVDLIVSIAMDIPFLIAFQADITMPFMKVKVNCILVFISIHFLITVDLIVSTTVDIPFLIVFHIFTITVFIVLIIFFIVLTTFFMTPTKPLITLHIISIAFTTRLNIGCIIVHAACKTGPIIPQTVCHTLPNVWITVLIVSI